MARAIYGRAVVKKPAKLAKRDAKAVRVQCPELIRAVRLAERQIYSTREVKPLPQRPWDRYDDS